MYVIAYTVYAEQAALTGCFEGNQIMNIIIKNKIDTPIYEQISTQIKNAVLEGKAAENEQLPSIRQLAKDLKISVITTTKAYSILEEEGYINAIPGKGYFIAGRNNELLKERLIMTVEENIESAVRNGRNAGLSDDELISMLKSELKGE